MKRFITNVKKVKAERVITQLGLAGFHLLAPMDTEKHTSIQLQKCGIAGLYVNSNIHNITSFFNEYNDETYDKYDI